MRTIHKNVDSSPTASPMTARVIPRIVAICAALELAKEVCQYVWVRLVVIPAYQGGFDNTQAARLGYLQVATSVIGFLVIPVVAYIVLYSEGRRFRIGAQTRALAASLFLGGALGVVAGLLIIPPVTSTDILAYLRTLPSTLSDPPSFLQLVLELVQSGLYFAFIGIAAAAIYEFSGPSGPKDMSSPSPEPPGPSASEGSAKAGP